MPPKERGHCAARSVIAVFAVTLLFSLNSITLPLVALKILGSLDCGAILRHFPKRLNAKRVKNESLAGDSENWPVFSGLYRL